MCATGEWPVISRSCHGLLSFYGRMLMLYIAKGTAVWYGNARVVCDADTDGMAKHIADALNAYGKAKKGGK